MARYVITLSESEAASLDAWMADHSRVILRSTGGTWSWHPLSVQREDRVPVPRALHAVPTAQQIPGTLIVPADETDDQ